MLFLISEVPLYKRDALATKKNFSKRKTPSEKKLSLGERSSRHEKSSRREKPTLSPRKRYPLEGVFPPSLGVVVARQLLELFGVLGFVVWCFGVLVFGCCGFWVGVRVLGFGF